MDNPLKAYLLLAIFQAIRGYMLKRVATSPLSINSSCQKIQMQLSESCTSCQSPQ